MNASFTVALLVVLLILSPSDSSAQAGTPVSAAGAEAGQLLLDEAAEGFFDESLPNSAVRSLLDRSRGAFSLLAEPCQNAYWQARVQYLYGFVEQADGRPKEADARFRESLELAGRSLECGESSEGYRLMADAQAQLLVSGNLAYKMAHGQRARQWVLRAVELDPGNAAAQLSLALYYKNAPGIAGGDKARARRILHELETRSDLQRSERFSVNTWLGIVYSEQKDKERARSYLTRAQAIYPGNTWLREMLAEM